MGIEDGTTEYKLQRELEYRHKGNAQIARFVVLREPIMDHVKHYLKLKQMIMRAQMELAKQADEINKLRDAVGHEVKPFTEDAERIEKEADDMAEAIGLALQAAESVDIGAFIDTFQAMACMKSRKSICIIDDTVQMTDALWSNLYPDDAFNMAVRWCSFFGMPSTEGDKTTLDRQSGSLTGQTVV